MILLGKGKATLFSERAIGSRSSRRLEARMIGGRASCVVSEAAFLRITVNSMTDADTGELEWAEIAFRIGVGKRSIKAVQILGLFKTENCNWDHQMWHRKTYEALRYTLGVYCVGIIP